MRFTSLTLAAGLVALAQANDTIFYEINTCNSGSYSGCRGVSSGVCCVTKTEGEAAAISISKAPLDFATMWSGGGCKTMQCSAGGSGTFCCIWNQKDLLTGGLFNTLHKNNRADPKSQAKCTSKMEANVIGYAADDGSAWEIHADNMSSALSQGKTFDQMNVEYHQLSSEEKVEWLKAHGATKKAKLHEEPLTIAHAK
ncbi:hypothetical protein FQN49_006226 [Arthroderma sp. PD_2]|nr:hypothetical protein FQN49_006226 [Arthroderma sp. PD_2]